MSRSASTEAAAMFDRDGPNEAPEKKLHPFLSFVRKFCGLSAWMLELISALPFVLDIRADFAAALTLLVVNAVLSFLQEQRLGGGDRTGIPIAGHGPRASRRAVATDAGTVTGRRRYYVIAFGDFVPADVQIIDGKLKINQSALTGESRELNKITNNPVYSGSIVRQGEATAVVVGTGTQTYFGRTTQLDNGTIRHLSFYDVNCVRAFLALARMLFKRNHISDIVSRGAKGGGEH